MPELKVEKRMLPSLCHDPPVNISPESQIATGGPPRTSIRYNLLVPTTKAIDLLSGDQTEIRHSPFQAAAAQGHRAALAARLRRVLRLELEADLAVLLHDQECRERAPGARRHELQEILVRWWDR